MRKRKLLLSISPALVLVIVSLTGCNPDTTVLGVAEGINLSNQQQGIWVAGMGEVTASPDVAILSLGVEVQAATVAEAQTQAAEAMDAVMGVLSDHSVASKDIKTQYYSIYPVRMWDDDKETLIGYRVANTVSVRIRIIEDAGSIIDAVTAAGGDNTRINGISFTADDPDIYEVEAREKAMADAKAKAEQLAELAGVTLGKPTYIVESGGYMPMLYREFDLMEGAPSAATTPISPGEMEISLSVQVIYSIN